MKLLDYIDLSLSNLWKRKLRTSLTTFGVIIGIGALVSMVAFGKGMQRNVTETFRSLELFNYITVFTEGFNPFDRRDSTPEGSSLETQVQQKLDEVTINTIKQLPGVESVLPDIRFPAEVSYKGKTRFTLVQVLPVQFATSKIVTLREGSAYTSDDERAMIISDSLLNRMGIEDFSSVIGQKILVSALIFDLSGFDLGNLGSILSGAKLPFAKEDHELTVVGVSERMGFGGPSLLRSDIYLPAGVADSMNKISISNLWDLFRTSEREGIYSVLNVKLSSPKYIDSIKTKIEKMGFRTFALIDQLEEIRAGFVYLDMFLFAIGMIAIVVASLGIMNTMVMSIMERYAEIGIMKAVGAENRDIEKIFFFESSVIGFFGGLLGLGLGWVVSQLINLVVNSFLTEQGVPFIEYFSFPWWLCLGAIGFAILVSLASGIYPAMRAARVDPVVALRHD